MAMVPQSFQNQGSKRALVPLILGCLIIGFGVLLFSGCETDSYQQAIKSRPQIDYSSWENFSISTEFSNSVEVHGYEKAMFNAVVGRWFWNVGRVSYPEGYIYQTGQMVVSFVLNADGKISDLMVSKNTVGSVLAQPCLSAINDSAPFPAWPDEVKKTIGKDYREITFTFNYGELPKIFACDSESKTNLILFRTYDRVVASSIQKRWYDILNGGVYPANGKSPNGKVVIEFHLNPDGTVSDLDTVTNTVESKLSVACSQAITNCAPFKKWTDEQKKEIGKDYRKITFTFYYYDDWRDFSLFASME